MDDEDGYFGERAAATYDDTSEDFGPGAVDEVAGVLAGSRCRWPAAAWTSTASTCPWP